MESVRLEIHLLIIVNLSKIKMFVYKEDVNMKINYVKRLIVEVGISKNVMGNM